MKLKYQIIFLLSLLFNLNFGIVFSQESVRITYEVLPRLNPEELTYLESQKIAIQANRVLSEFQFELLINDNESTFRMIHQPIPDSIDILLYKLAQGFSAGDEIWYTKSGSFEKLIHKEDLDGAITLTLNEEVQWEIGKETKQIGKYEVIKATTSRKLGGYTEEIEAWFAPELPYSFGPSGYNGLPGLILAMKRDKVVYMFKEIQKNTGEIEPPEEAKRSMTFEAYYQMLEEHMAGIKKRG